MHRKPEIDMLPLEIEIERMLQNLRKITVAESRSMANQRERWQVIIEEEEEAKRTHRPNTMEDFWRPSIQDEYSAISD